MKNPTTPIRIDKCLAEEISEFCRQTGLPKSTAIQRMWTNYKSTTDYHIIMGCPRRKKEEKE